MTPINMRGGHDQAPPLSTMRCTLNPQNNEGPAHEQWKTGPFPKKGAVLKTLATREAASFRKQASIFVMVYTFFLSPSIGTIFTWSPTLLPVSSLPTGKDRRRYAFPDLCPTRPEWCTPRAPRHSTAEESPSFPWQRGEVSVTAKSVPAGQGQRMFQFRPGGG